MMADLIDRTALANRMQFLIRTHQRDAFDALNEIDNAPAVDAVEVVRCKDCIGWTMWLKTKEPSVSVCGLSGLYVGNHRDDLFVPTEKGGEMMRRFKRGVLEMLVLMAQLAVIGVLIFGPIVLAAAVQKYGWMFLLLATFPIAYGFSCEWWG